MKGRMFRDAEDGRLAIWQVHEVLQVTTGAGKRRFHVLYFDLAHVKESAAITAQDCTTSLLSEVRAMLAAGEVYRAEAV